ncbi:MAG: glycogen synthase GlgA [Gammaproteobacteria bacterium]|nr:glycogen synthase GlgA [Gammaproteobacteria bacterium]
MAADRIIFASSEAYPLIKTGGLADVSASLPAALRSIGKDVRLIIPAYRSVIDSDSGPWVNRAQIALPGCTRKAEILEGRLPGTDVATYLLYAPEFFDRNGGPYSDASGQEWPDNAERFGAFCHAIAAIANGTVPEIDWRPDVVHCNDWQTGLVPALLSGHADRPATIFTVHNLAYQGLFPHETYKRLGLPDRLWSLDGLEFHHQMSFIKGGLVYSDALTTVSPTYAREITTEAFGCGLDGLLRSKRDRLVGILNGADYCHWDPAQDTHLTRAYGPDTLDDKAANKQALQRYFDLPEDPNIPIAGMVARIAHQKGLDLILGALDEILSRPLQLVVLGNGDKTLEAELLSARERHPDRIGVHIGYQEALSHQIEGGADMFLMPSRYEPCGLNQIYSLRYGTPPIVHHTGGLADTVVDSTAETLADGTATGFVFHEPTTEALAAAIGRAIDLYRDSDAWRQIVLRGMAQDFGWKNSALAYNELYEKARARPV